MGDTSLVILPGLLRALPGLDGEPIDVKHETIGCTELNVDCDTKMNDKMEAPPEHHRNREVVIEVRQDGATGSEFGYNETVQEREETVSRGAEETSAQDNTRPQSSGQSQGANGNLRACGGSARTEREPEDSQRVSSIDNGESERAETLDREAQVRARARTKQSTIDDTRPFHVRDNHNGRV